MKPSARVKSLDLPLSEVVVIGSGLLDELGLRSAHDLDLAVSPTLFEKLRDSGEFTITNEGQTLRHNELEIWIDWPPRDFAQLYENGQTINGVRFVDTQFLISQKQARGSQKDRHDIALLEGYYDRIAQNS